MGGICAHPAATRSVDLAPDTPADELRQEFDALDLDGSGYLERDEILAIVKPYLDSDGVSKEKTEELLDKYFEEVDTDHDGKINYEELVVAMKEPVEMPPADLVRQMFHIWDLDGSGYLEIDEMKAWMKEWLIEESGAPEAKINEILDQMIEEMLEEDDRDHDGKISCEELIAMLA